MDFNKNAITLAVASCFSLPTSSYADIINYDFTGTLSIVSATGVIALNSDASTNQDFGFRTNIIGSGSFDTITGAGIGSMEAFSFFGSGLATVYGIQFQAIGDGSGGVGSLVASQMTFDWAGKGAFPITAVYDASGFFANTVAQGLDAGINCAGCATSTTPDWVFGPFSGSVGAVPIAMTDFNTAGTTLDSIFPLLDDGISGSPNTTSPLPGFNMGFDFTSTTIDLVVAQVPIPATFWLFGSGLVGLVGFAKRHNKRTV